jgi:hypothetical protein
MLSIQTTKIFEAPEFQLHAYYKKLRNKTLFFFVSIQRILIMTNSVKVNP